MGRYFPARLLPGLAFPASLLPGPGLVENATPITSRDLAIIFLPRSPQVSTPSTPKSQSPTAAAVLPSPTPAPVAGRWSTPVPPRRQPTLAPPTYARTHCPYASDAQSQELPCIPNSAALGRRAASPNLGSAMHLQRRAHSLDARTPPPKDASAWSDDAGALHLLPGIVHILI
jgi:hypothetical protein